jgi:long-chain-fatty-acid--CoA ligase ACSBG
MDNYKYIALIILFLVTLFYAQYDQDLFPPLHEKSFIELFSHIAHKYPQFPALKYKVKNNKDKNKNIWKTITYKNYFRKCQLFASTLEKINIPEGEKICIMGSNSPFWLYSYLGCMMANCISVSLYFSAQQSSCEEIINEIKPVGLIVDSQENLLKFNHFIYQKDCSLKFIILYEEKITVQYPIPLYTWNQFIKKSKKRKINIQNNNISTIVYTSGTVNKQKGVLISHQNIISMLQIINKKLIQSKLYIEMKKERFISYLPLNHIAAQIIEICFPICVCGTLWIADKNIIRKDLSHLLKRVRPTILCCVPRVLEKMMETITSQSQKNSFFQKIKPLSQIFTYVDDMIIKKIGLDRCQFLFNTAGCLPPRVEDFFNHMNLPIYNIYGMSEATGPITLSLPFERKLRSVGKPLFPHQIKIVNQEIWIKGPTLFQGYFHEDPKKTFKDGWFNTGDLGYLNQNGYLFINGRKKEIIITSGGEKVNPLTIEEKIRKTIPIINDVMIVGDNQKYIVALLTLKLQLNDHQEPTILFHPETEKFLQMIGSKSKTTVDLEDDAILQKFIDQQILNINNKAISNVHKIKKWVILPTVFTIKTGELTSTLKYKRKFIEDKYQNDINKLYK